MIQEAFLKSGYVDAGRIVAGLKRKGCRNAGGLSGRHARRDFFGGFMDDAVRGDAASCYDQVLRALGQKSAIGDMINLSVTGPIPGASDRVVERLVPFVLDEKMAPA